MNKTEFEIMSVKVPMNETDFNQKAEELQPLLKEQGKLLIAKKTVGEKLKTIEEQIDRLVSEIASKMTIKELECCWIFNWHKASKTLVSKMEDGTVYEIKTEIITELDRQLKLEYEQKEKEAKKEPKQ